VRVASESEVEHDDAPIDEASWQRFATQRTAKEPYSRKLERYRMRFVVVLVILGLLALLAAAFFLLDGLPVSMRWREHRYEAISLRVTAASFGLAGILWLWPRHGRSDDAESPTPAEPDRAP
jgi:protein-S-isoprenylcysteine O-methyltransferase Ste14